MIIEIKKEISLLSADGFQQLCSSYFIKKGYENNVILGSSPGTNKTKSGTPDIYFFEKGKYVFVECTTSISNATKLFRKLKTDIENCLNVSKTGVNHSQILKIICCHTSSNLSPQKDYELKSLGQKPGIEIEIIGIDKLAEDILSKYQILANDFLDLPISTSQILTLKDFIRDYNSNPLRARIDTKFLFREKEIDAIGEAFEQVDVVILTGSAGTGKTRLALHYAELVSKKGDCSTYVIQNKGSSLLRELQIYFSKPGEYFVVIDDANHLTELQHIMHYIHRQSKGCSVKTLITVRNSAIGKVCDDIQDFFKSATISIEPFDFDQIVSLLETALDIKKHEVRERIATIAEGNPRLAILAGLVVVEKRCLNSINDATDLFDAYYKSFITSFDGIFKDNNIAITAGIIAFLEVVNLNDIENLTNLFDAIKIKEESFLKYVTKLYENEIIDMHYGKIAQFKDQTLANYFLKYIFYDKKYIKLSTILKCCFSNYQSPTISSINSLLDIFRNQNLISFVTNEISMVWDEFEKEPFPIFFHFMRHFYQIKPTQTLTTLNNLLEYNREKTNDSLETFHTRKVKDEIYLKHVLDILGGFKDTSKLSTALELYLEFYIINTDLAKDFKIDYKRHFGINKDSFKSDFQTQILALKKLEEYSQDWTEKSINKLFLSFAKELLKVEFSPIVHGRGLEYRIYRIQLRCTPEVKEYRAVVWRLLAELNISGKYLPELQDLFKNYGEGARIESRDVIENDLFYLNPIFETHFPPDKFKNCLLANKLNMQLRRLNISNELFDKYLKHESIQLYQLLIGNEYDNKISYEKWQENEKAKIKQFASTLNETMIQAIIDLACEIEAIDRTVTWNIKDSIVNIFDTISSNKEFYIISVEYYLKRNTPCNINPHLIVSALFSMLKDDEVHEIINKYSYKEKNNWQFAYFCEIPKNMLTNKHLKSLYIFLADTAIEITSSTIRDLNFLKAYEIFDENVFIKSCEIILKTAKDLPFLTSLYFRSLFNESCFAPKTVVQKFKIKLDLYEEIYFMMILYTKEIDSDGSYLIEFYKTRPLILNRYIDHLITSEIGFCSFEKKRLQSFFNLPDFSRIYNTIINNSHENYFITSILEGIILVEKDTFDLAAKSDEWIQQYIEKHANDKRQMKYLFDVVYKLSFDLQEKYVLLFAKFNPNHEDLKNILTLPSAYFWSGSKSSVYSERIIFLEQLLPKFEGRKWLKHKSLIENIIKNYQKIIKRIKIKEISEGYPYTS